MDPVPTLAASSSTGGAVDATLDPSGLRVAILSDAIPGRNGVGTYYDDLAAHLRPRVEELRLVTPPRDPEASYGGLRFPLPGDETQALFVPWPWTLRRELTGLRPHVVLAATPSAYGIAGMVLAHATGAGFCVGHHTQLDELADLYWTSLFGRVTVAALGLWDRLVRRTDATVLVHNAELVDELREGGTRDVRLMGTPTAPGFIDPPVRPLRPEANRVIFVGRLAPEKRVDQVLALARTRPDLHVRVVGDGPLRGEVDAAAADLPNLEALPWVPRARVVELLDDSDLLVLPSVYETFGTAALEAMARGRIAVVSDRCGIGLWPELAPGLVRMAPEEPLVAAVDRVRSATPEERAGRAATARAAAEALTERTVEHWLSVLVGLAAATAA